MVRVVVCPMNINLLFDRGQQSGVLKPTKNGYFQVFLGVCFFYPKFLGMLRNEIYLNSMK